MSDSIELTDEEKMMNLLEELQKENEDLRQRLHHQPQPQNMEPLLKTLRQQEQEITRLNSSLIEEQSQNERLLELAKNEEKLNSENKKLLNEVNRLNSLLSQKNAQLKELSTQASAVADKFKNLPATAEVDKFNESFGKAVRVMDSLRWYHIVNWLVVVVFGAVVVFNFVGLWLLRDGVKETLIQTQQTNRAIYAPEGYSVLPGSQSSNEYWDARQNNGQ